MNTIEWVMTVFAGLVSLFSVLLIIGPPPGKADRLANTITPASEQLHKFLAGYSGRHCTVTVTRDGSRRSCEQPENHWIHISEGEK